MVTDLAGSGDASHSPPPAAAAPPLSPAAIAADVSPWIERAAARALDLKETLDAAVGSAVGAAATAASTAASFSAHYVEESKEIMESVKAMYEFHEEMAFAKIKEGVLLAASNPGLSSGIAAGLGLIFFRRPRNFLIQNARRLFVSEEVLLSSAKTKVNGLRQSVNLVTNERIKLMERASNAEKEFQKGRTDLMMEGRAIERELRYVRNIEKQAMGLKVALNELPRTQASPLRARASELVSQVKKEKAALNGALTKIINYGIPV
ncbi:uncharacterized protein LOC109727708 [Ananas comosus]|uniref:Uncharacterized protein LOC109727708 n=1 Tax=Ananas comosus TaxID=4615 RepID=A0A199VGQ7_ANACO|nr:uncharacterized protein LOC109727708 [Ananas comosus]OAY76289.1 hypothetical protein ACMD2_11707 [Ananas comosus]